MKKILITEDDSLMAEIYRDNFENEGFAAEIAWKRKCPQRQIWRGSITTGWRRSKRSCEFSKSKA